MVRDVAAIGRSMSTATSSQASARPQRKRLRLDRDRPAASENVEFQFREQGCSRGRTFDMGSMGIDDGAEAEGEQDP